jgi:hypothetical protein
LSEKDNTKKESAYRVEGISIQAYLDEAGEFRWIPASQACSDKDNAKKILEVLRKMPEDRCAVWVKRFDTDQAKATCPIIHNEPDLCKEFDEFFERTYDTSKLRRAKPTIGGDSKK